MQPEMFGGWLIQPLFYSYSNSLVNAGKGYTSQVIIGKFNYKVLWTVSVFEISCYNCRQTNCKFQLHYLNISVCM